MKQYSVLLFLVLWISSASAQQLYFPAPQANSVWETSDPDALGWCSFALPPLLEFLEASNTKAFIVLKDGKIVIEEYFGTLQRIVLGTGQVRASRSPPSSSDELSRKDS